ncbi:PH domain-containing protein [Gimesia maris]|jgi:hypothetical protein|uniref:YokE-like PH domain-containing protein n=1 Tax=Gimesia maris TaxID=122 RepID=A0A3D3RDV2_9PLAN|nr:PH domain-containing protein [Gimesia maris]MAC51801.1 hypothetical protein [Gimesia sp.]QDT78831.1 hypothetical protein Mal35_22820 [Gimesia maris]HCO26197.1 hypothetical protein [Gimesia maris]|tara:strand:+ start:40744 stop:41640 length:897 start_codon:yes stop_codon:yes gene_type:complete
MSTVDSQAVDTKLTQLNLKLSPNINYRLETMFPKLEGMFAKSGIKKKFQLVKRLEPLLEEMLLEKEEVLFISKGNQSSFSEQFFMGALWAQTINHTAVVLTNFRLLCIRTNGKGKPKRTFWSIYYSQIKDLKSTIFGNAKICLKDGKNLNYSGFPKIDRKTMRSVFLDAYKTFDEKGFDPEVTQSRENLCGNCFAVVPKHDYHCEACDATFWKPSEVGVRSFFFPSWGDFVMKHYPVAFAEFCGFMILLVVLAAAISNGNYGFAVILFVLANGGDAAITAQIAAKGLHLKSVPESQSA